MSISVALSELDVLASLDVVDLKMLSLQMAASVLSTIYEISTNATSGTKFTLSGYVNWSPHGFTNAMQTMVEFLYAAIPALSQRKYLFGRGEKDLIKDALVAYQQYKTSLVEQDQIKHGKGFGLATQFAKMDWTDRNNLL